MHQEGCARRAAWDSAKNIYKPKNSDKATFCNPIEAKAMRAPTSTRPEERDFVVDSGASMHMVSKKELCSEEMDTLKKVQNLHCGIDCQWRSAHIREEAQVFVHDLILFVTVQLLEETIAVLSLGKLCEDHGYSYEWVSGQKPRLTKEVKTIMRKTDNLVPLVVPGLSANSGCSSSSTSTLQDLSSTRPAQDRSDGPGPRRLVRITAKNQNQNKKRDGDRDLDDRL